MSRYIEPADLRRIDATRSAAPVCDGTCCQHDRDAYHDHEDKGPPAWLAFALLVSLYLFIIATIAFIAWLSSR